MNKNQFKQKRNFEKQLSLESMIELFSFDNYKYGGSNEYRTTYKTPVQKFANHFFIHKYLSSSVSF